MSLKCETNVKNRASRPTGTNFQALSSLWISLFTAKANCQNHEKSVFLTKVYWSCIAKANLPQFEVKFCLERWIKGYEICACYTDIMMGLWILKDKRRKWTFCAAKCTLCANLGKPVGVSMGLENKCMYSLQTGNQSWDSLVKRTWISVLYSTFKGKLHLKPQWSMFFALSQNYQHFFFKE